MKNILLALCALMIGLFVYAQNNTTNNNYHPLVQEGKVWSVVFVMGDIWDYHFTTTQMVIWGDTIINDIQYKKMYASTKKYPIFPQDWILNNFIREDENKKVWYKDKNSSSVEKLYYDFSLEIGDTLPDSLGLSMPPNYPFEPVIVENITSITLLNGEERKVWHLSMMCVGLYNNIEFWIEGIGSSLGVANPLGGGLIGGFYRLHCVHENEELVYNANLWGATCYISGSIGINDYDNQINIFPNPAKDIIYIDNIDNLEISAISIVNIQGQIIRQFEPTTQLNISNIENGIYFIKLSSSKGNIIKKILINQ
jgi:hypothetical protein